MLAPVNNDLKCPASKRRPVMIPFVAMPCQVIRGLTSKMKTLLGEKLKSTIKICEWMCHRVGYEHNLQRAYPCATARIIN